MDGGSREGSKAELCCGKTPFASEIAQGVWFGDMSCGACPTTVST